MRVTESFIDWISVVSFSTNWIISRFGSSIDLLKTFKIIWNSCSVYGHLNESNFNVVVLKFKKCDNIIYFLYPWMTDGKLWVCVKITKITSDDSGNERESTVEGDLQHVQDLNGNLTSIESFRKLNDRRKFVHYPEKLRKVRLINTLKS